MTAPAKPPANSATRILFASLVGTTIELFDFYIYGTAAVLVFPKLFFPSGNETTAILQSFATFSLAFFARPVGAAVFGHFGDRIGRKATLVVALLTMGLSTVCIGLLPTYQSVGVLAPILLCLCRFGQGVGLGGEWGGAVLLATENAPPGKRSWYGMFPQLGAPLGFMMSNAVFLLLGWWMNDEAFFNWGWRVPFLASAVLVFVGLYVRVSLEETPEFRAAMNRQERVRVPLLTMFKDHVPTLVLGTAASLTIFVLFYLMTIFSLSWGTKVLNIPRQDFLWMQMVGVVCFGIAVVLSGAWADRFGSRRVLQLVTMLIIGFGLLFAPIFGTGSTTQAVIFLCVGLGLMGLSYGPISTELADLFPTAVRYTGASVAYSFASILGGSFAPIIAQWLGDRLGLEYVGYYLSIVGAITLLAFWLIGRWHNRA